MPLGSKDLGSSIPPSARAPNSQLISPRRRWPRKSSLNLRMPPLTPAIRLPRNLTGLLMIWPTTPATRASTFLSIAASSRIVLITALIAPMALSIRPLFSACSSSIRSSRPLRASTYLVARVSTSASCLASTSLSSCSNRSPISFDASDPTFCQVLRQALDVVGDLGPAGRDPSLGRRQVVADDVGDPGDDLVHLLEIELAAGHVELVDLVRHPLDLVPGPAERSEPAAVPVLLVRRHLRRDIALEHRLVRRPPPAPNSFSTSGSMPSRIFLTSASVALKIPSILVVTSARFASSLDLALPLSATSFARAAPLLLCIPATPPAVSAAASALPWAMTCASCCRNSPGAVSACSAAAFLSASAPVELRLVRLGQLVLADLAVGHLRVGLVLAGGQVELFGRRRLGHGAGRRDRHGA